MFRAIDSLLEDTVETPVSFYTYMNGLYNKIIMLYQ